jgi:hypothetical protein
VCGCGCVFFPLLISIRQTGTSSSLRSGRFAIRRSPSLPISSSSFTAAAASCSQLPSAGSYFCSAYEHDLLTLCACTRAPPPVLAHTLQLEFLHDLPAEHQPILPPRKGPQRDPSLANPFRRTPQTRAVSLASRSYLALPYCGCEIVGPAD